MKETALLKKHRQLKARMVTFAGYEMPLEYSGVRDEHQTVRKSVGVFDVSHMGEIWIKGPAAGLFLQRMTSNDIQLMYPGRVQYSCLPNGNGGIVDDLLVYMVDDQKYFLVVNAANISKDREWLVSQNREGAELEDASGRMAQIAVQGPRAMDTVRKLCDRDLTQMKHYTFWQGSFAGVEEVIFSTTGYTGEPGAEIYFNNRDAEKVWDAILEAGSEYGIKPVGLAARDTLRLEMGFCLYGNDIDDSTSPIEAGLGWITKFNDGNDFIDRERLERQKARGVDRKLVGFVLKERGIPRQHYQILDMEGEVIGEVSSGTLSPMLNAGIGMGYVKAEHDTPGAGIQIRIRNKDIPAVVVRPPIYKHGMDDE